MFVPHEWGMFYLSYKNNCNTAGSLCPHYQSLLYVGCLARSRNKDTIAVVWHLYALIGFVHIANNIVFIKQDN